MRFFLYGTSNVDPFLATNVTEWGLDPVEGEYDPRFEWTGRGAAVQTLGGLIVQDYGLKEVDRKIRIVGRDLNDELRLALEQKYSTTDGEFNFTARANRQQASDVWRVKFSRVPRGLVTTLDGHLWAVGRAVSEPPPAEYVRYRYEVALLVTQKLA